MLEIKFSLMLKTRNNIKTQVSVSRLKRNPRNSRGTFFYKFYHARCPEDNIVWENKEIKNSELK